MSVNLPENSDSIQQREILDALPVLVFLERAGKIVFANAEARQLLRLPEGELIERPVEEVLWGLSSGTAEPQTLLTGGMRGSPFHATLLPGSGRLQPVEGTYCVLNADLREAVIVAHPGGRAMAPKSDLMEDVLASIPEAVVIVLGEHLLYTNPAFTRMFGYTAEEVSGGQMRDFIVPPTRQHEIPMLRQAVDQNGRVAIETVRMNKQGELVDVSLLAGPLVVKGKKVGYAFSFRDIGERKEVEARLQHDAMHDVLTGLPNRALFLDRLTQALTRRERRRDQSCGVLFVDLDRFKEINDTMGHSAGDELLLAAAERLRMALRPQDTAARLGGDEFAILVENILNANDLDIVASRVSRDLQEPYDIYGKAIPVGASIGVAMAGPDHSTPEALIRDADFAMYRAKQEGGGRYEIFDRRLEVRVSTRQERERELRHMLESHQFEIWYQPIYRLSSGKLEGFESLLRWRRAGGAIDSIGDLFSVAEDTGLSISVGRETAESVCRQQRLWRDVLPESDLTLGINVSNRQFYHPDMVAQLKKVLAETGADPTHLLFEVAETTLNENPDAAVAILQRLVDNQVRVAVDNFGSSLAPINHLVRLPIDVVKVDPKLTASAMAGGRHAAVLESIIHLGRSLGVQVVAQGIETSEQLDKVRRLGCEFGQGHLMEHAVDPVQAQALAAEGYCALWPPA
jgi:diguanylate cyclase (GGDEF)-like protein/PAS domain S-box-containing protein